MTVNRTTLLDLPLPVTGTEPGTWGDTTNNGLTQYLDIAIAGTLVLSTDADVTLASTEGDSSATNIGATTAQYAILRWTATGSTTRNITALAQSKTYVVINATGGTQSIVLRGAGPTTGVTIISGEKAHCVWNGSDFVKVSSSAAAGGSNTQVQYNSLGVLAGVSGATTNGTAITFSTTNLKLQGSSTGVSSFASANSSATDYTVTFPAASTTIPVATQTLTFSGPTAARTITLPDANFTAARTDAAQTFTGVQTFSSNPVLDGGTANGVLYLNGSKVATSGSALTFDGTNFRLISAGSLSGTAFGAFAVASAGTPTTAYASVLSTAGTYNGGFESTLYLGSARTDIVNNGTVSGYRLKVVNTSAASDSYLAFESGSSATGAFAPPSTYAEQMRLTSTGLGIGTSSPSFKLDVNGGLSAVRTNGATGSQVTYSVNGTETAIAYVDATQHILGSSTAIPVIFRTQGTEKMRLDSSGNLGLGVTPSAWSSGGRIEIGNDKTIVAQGPSLLTGTNLYFNAGFKYVTTGNATYYYQTAGAHQWFTAPSGTAGNAITFTQAMTLDASGNLGVGTTAPQATIVAAGSNATVYKAMILRNGNGTDGSSVTIDFETSSGTQGSEAAMAGRIAGLRIGSGTSGALTFSTTNAGTLSERARIDSSGNLLVGTTSLTAPLDSSTNEGFVYEAGAYLAIGRDSGTVAIFNRKTNDGDLIAMRSRGVAVGSISVTSSATAYNTSSDYRLKDNPQPLTGSGAFIDALQPKTWNWKADGSRGVGFIAHEVQEVSPGSVVGEKDGEQMQAMEYGSAEFIANIIAELQSLRQRVALLEGN